MILDMVRLQFSTRDVLLAVALAATGCGIEVFIRSALHGYTAENMLFAMPFWGAAVGALVRKKRLGAYFGTFVGVLLLCIFSEPLRHP
jgi:hypothetical protein